MHHLFYVAGIFSLFLFTSIIGCGKGNNSTSNNSSGGDATPSTAAPATPNAATPKAGMASGVVLGEDKKPINLAGAKIKVVVSGVSLNGGENIAYSAVPDASGHYSMKLTDGRYQASATIEVPFDGKVYDYDLIPTGPKPAHDDQDSADGPVFNFEWHIRGPKFESSNDPKDWTQWCGGPVDVHFDHFSLPQAPGGTYFFPPEKTKFVFSLKPTSKLVDGTDGKPLSFERKYDSVMMDVDNQTLNDIPLGKYELSGKELTPDGKETPLVFSVSTDQKNFAPTAAVDFNPRDPGKAQMGSLYVFKMGK